ncbi:MAG: T9SS type A sorting domain-containing protein [candidate division Zixibacteria bacterium]|nr:T9SS type A sorting domain-containing protein [candidate division Zixibacteria bacterium]
MKKLLLIVAAVLITSATSGHSANNLYVVNGLAETVSKINLDNGVVSNHIINTGLVPNDIKIEGDKAYILNSTSDDIHILNLATDTVIDTIAFSRYENPWEIYIDGDLAYVTNWLSGNLYEVDLKEGMILRAFAVGSTIEGVFRHGDRLFVTDVNFDFDNYTYGDGILYYANLPDLDEWQSLNVGINPQRIIGGPDGNLHIICSGNYADVFGAIYIVDPINVTIVDSINIGGSPGYAAVNGSGKVFVGAGGWGDHGEVYCYDGTTYAVLNDPSNPIITDPGASGITADLDGNVYCCNSMPGVGTVSKIDAQRQVVDSYNVGDGASVAALYNTETGIEGDTVPFQPEIGLSAYPNPFNDKTTIIFKLPDAGEIELAIHNLNGQRLTVLEDGFRRGGKHSVNWDAAGFSSGVYFYQLKAGDKVISKRMTLLK